MPNNPSANCSSHSSTNAPLSHQYSEVTSSDAVSNAVSDYAPSMGLDMAHKRADMLAKIRRFFAERQVLEVQTPVLSQAANTDVFVPSIAAEVMVQDSPKTYYLHTSPEFAMKRMLAAWQVAIYQICPVFRNNEVGQRHNSEFTMLEWYRPSYDLNELTNELSDLLAVLYGHSQIMTHYSYVQAFMDYVGIHPLTATCEVLSAIAADHNIKGLNLGDDHQGWLDVLFSHMVEPHLGHDMPTLIIDYPPATAALAKIAVDNAGNRVAKRFELYINGVEIANAYDELADAQALRQRFIEDNKQRAQRGLPQMPIDERLLAACAQMPECSGIALGVDRLLMVLTGAKTIDEVIGFEIGRA